MDGIEEILHPGSLTNLGEFGTHAFLPSYIIYEIRIDLI